MPEFDGKMVPRRTAIIVQYPSTEISLEPPASSEEVEAIRETETEIGLPPGRECVQRIYVRSFSEGERTLSYRVGYMASANLLASSESDSGQPGSHAEKYTYPTSIEGVFTFPVVQPLQVDVHLLSPLVCLTCSLLHYLQTICSLHHYT